MARAQAGDPGIAARVLSAAEHAELLLSFSAIRPRTDDARGARIKLECLPIGGSRLDGQPCFGGEILTGREGVLFQCPVMDVLQIR